MGGFVAKFETEANTPLFSSYTEEVKALYSQYHSVPSKSMSNSIVPTEKLKFGDTGSVGKEENLPIVMVMKSCYI